MSKATVCQACGGRSWAGKVCRPCLRFWGGPAENVLAAVALRVRMERCVTVEDVVREMSGLTDVIVPDWPGVDMAPLVHSR